MSIPSDTACRTHRLTCPLCERGLLYLMGTGFARCGYCGMPLIGSALETLRDVVALPDALGSHLCECGHSEMCHLSYGVFHCPACHSEVPPFKVSRCRGQGVPRLLAGGADTPPNHRRAAGIRTRQSTREEIRRCSRACSMRRHGSSIARIWCAKWSYTACPKRCVTRASRAVRAGRRLRRGSRSGPPAFSSSS
jgi:hypothetical protein